MPKDKKAYTYEELTDKGNCSNYTLTVSDSDHYAYRGKPLWTYLGNRRNVLSSGNTYTDGEVVFGEYRETPDRTIYQLHSDGLYREVSPEQIAADWAAMKAPEPQLPPKRTFGQWMGVIFSFGLWKPAVETKPDRHRQRDEWEVIDAMHNAYSIKDDAFARLKKKYSPISSLRGEDIKTYVDTGIVMTEKKKAAIRAAKIKAKQKEYEELSKTAAGDKKATSTVVTKAVNALYHARANYVPKDGRFRRLSVLKDIEDEFTDRSGKSNDPMLLTTAMYYGKLAEDQEAYDKFGDEYNTVSYDIGYGLSHEDRFDRYHGHRDRIIMYNLQSIVALTDGKVTLTQLKDEFNDPNGQLAYNKVFPESGSLRPFELKEKIKLLMTRLQKTDKVPEINNSLNNSRNVSFDLNKS